MKLALKSLVGCSLALACLVGCIGQECSNTTVEKPSAKVKRAYAVSRITGADWQDELEKQYKAIALLPETNRIEFFKTILIHCEMFAAKSLNFAELVGSDSVALVKELNRFQKTSAFQKLSKEERQRVITWASHLDESGDSEKNLDKEVGKKITVEGIAQTAKLGAFVSTDSGNIYLADKKEWESEAVDKKVRVTGVLRQFNLHVATQKDGVWSAGTAADGQAYKLEKFSWECIK